MSLEMNRSRVTCTTCVAIAIAKGHLSCVRALLEQAPLQSEWFWLPALHVLVTELLDDETINAESSFDLEDLEDLLREWDCLPTCRHRHIHTSTSTSNPSSTSRESSSSSGPSIDREWHCDHIRSLLNGEEELLCVTRPTHSAFFAFSLTRLALLSNDSEMIHYFMDAIGMDYRKAIWDHWGLLEYRHLPLLKDPSGTSEFYLL